MEHQPIISACDGCNKIKDGICIAYLEPAKRHRLCECPLKSGKYVELVNSGKKVNPLKASKRSVSKKRRR